MKVVTFSAISEKGLDKQVNHFLEMSGEDIQVQSIQFSTAVGVFAAMIVYTEVEK